MSIATVLDDLRLSLPDIAETARVRRPVVSTWRRRHAGGPHPFPEPVAERHGSPRFQASDVVAWIEATGLGNNEQFRADVALGASLDVDDPQLAERLRTGFAAMLALKAATDEPLAALDGEDLLDLADEVDPHDDHLYAEIAALGPDQERVAALADLAADAAFTPGAAAEALVADRHRARRLELTASALAPAALHLVARLAAQVGGEGTVADPNPGCGDLLRAVLAGADGIDVPTALVPSGHRAARRRLAAHGWTPATLDADGSTPLPPSGALVVTQIPSTGTPELSDLEVLRRVDEIVLGLHPHQRAIVIGPASALAEATDARTEAVRSALLRTDRLRAALVLPPGLVTDRSRQRLGLWVLGAPPDVSIADRWTMVADLSDQPFDETFARGVVDDLLTDIEASLGGLDTVRAHSFRFARFVKVAQHLARGGSLVEPGQPVARGSLDDGGAAAVRITELTAMLDGGTRPSLGARVERGEAVQVRQAGLGALADERRVRRVPGNRLDAAHVVDAPERDPELTRVLGVDELTGSRPWGSRGIDTLLFAEAYPSGRLTEPGDVVVTSTPHPAAAVDHDGFSVVESPAWVLRVTRRPKRDDGAWPGAVVVPGMVARDVGAQAPGAKRWRAWETRLVSEDQADEVARVLRAADARAAAARRELAHLDELAEALCDGVAAGVVRMRLDETTHP